MTVHAACLAARQPAVLPHHGLPVARSSVLEFQISQSMPVTFAKKTTKHKCLHFSQQHLQQSFGRASGNRQFVESSSAMELTLQSKRVAFLRFSCIFIDPSKVVFAGDRFPRLRGAGSVSIQTSPRQHEPLPPFWQAHYPLLTCPAIPGSATYH